jgi:filamentous hemagglutinin family protein
MWRIHWISSNKNIRGSAGTIALAAFLWATATQAGPQGGVVTSGSASIGQTGGVINVTQTTEKAAINWQSFSISPTETVNFLQPNAAAITLNRVIGNEASVIQGALNATGQVFLINSAGVLFAKGSSVNTGGFVASTLNLSVADFNSDKFVFSAGNSGGSVTNQGTLVARDGGYIGLLAGTVSNQGTIVATKGTVTLAGGSKVTLNMNGNSLLSVVVDEGALNALVENNEAIYADGGRVILTARAADNLLAAQVNNDGLIEARTIDDIQGSISLLAPGGNVHVAGILDASAPEGGAGGSVDTSGSRVQVANGAVVTTLARFGKTGTWLIDPDGMTVGPGGDISATQLGQSLADNNVALSSTQGSGSSGDLNVTGAVSWTANTVLSLSATHDVNVGAPISATGDLAGLTLSAGNNINISDAVTLSGGHAAMTMNYGGFAAVGTASPNTDYFINNVTTGKDGSLTIGPAAITLPGDSASLSINGQTYTLIHSMAQLAAISPPVLDQNGNIILSPDTGTLEFTPASGYFAIAQNLDAAGIVYPYAVVNTLNGTLAGLGHNISNLSVSALTLNPYNNAENAALIGTFGQTSADRLRDLGLVNVDISGGAAAAGLTTNSWGAISNTYVNGGKIFGTFGVGGLVANNYDGTVDNSHAVVTITAGNDTSPANSVGGLVGSNYSTGDPATGVITNSTAKGSITAAGVELPDGGLINSIDIGGLVGINYGSIINSHAYVDINTTNSYEVGGLVGWNFGGNGIGWSVGLISNSSAAGKMNVVWTNAMVIAQNFGGLVGENTDGTIQGSTANVDMNLQATNYNKYGFAVISNVGGLVGSNDSLLGTGSTISNSAASGNITTVGTVWEVGGGVGYNLFSTIDGLTATGNLTGSRLTADLGGLVGANQLGTISNSKASGNVTGGWNVGGFAGTNGDTIVNSSASGNVKALGNQYDQTGNAGGLVGNNAGTITGSQATGSVSGTGTAIGGLVGLDTGTETGSTYTDVPAQQRAVTADANLHADSLVTPLTETPPALVAAVFAKTADANLDSHLVLGNSASYNADIDSITVDGMRYELRDKDKKK